MKTDFIRTPDGSQRITDANLKATKAFYVPDYTGSTLTINGNPDEDGALAHKDNTLWMYTGGEWVKVGGTQIYGNGIDYNLTSGKVELGYALTRNTTIEMGSDGHFNFTIQETSDSLRPHFYSFFAGGYSFENTTAGTSGSTWKSTLTNNLGQDWSTTITKLTVGAMQVMLHHTAGMLITDSIFSKGFSYFANYATANASNARWIPDKAYVDAAITTGVGGVGSVTSVSVVTANGVTGSVATATSTPAITLSFTTQASTDSSTKVATTAFVKSLTQYFATGLFIGSVDPATPIPGTIGNPFTLGTINNDVQLTASPINGTSVITKSYADNLFTGLSWKQEVVVGTTANITLSGTQTIDGIAVVAGNRVLVKNQTTQTQNGIYVVASGAWTRATDADSSIEIGSATVLLRKGTQSNTQWTCTNSTDPVIGSDNITFGAISGAGTYTNGTGISLSSNVFSLDATYVKGLFSATSPIFYDSSTGIISSQAASGSQNGYLTSGDWTTFNSKQATLSGTGFVKSASGVISYDTSVYLTANQTITLTSEVTGSGTSSFATTINKAIVPAWTATHTFQQTTGTGRIDSLLLTTIDAATLGNQKNSTALHFQGIGWGTTAGASESVDAKIYLIPTQSTVPFSTLNFDFSANGGAYGTQGYINSFGSAGFADITATKSGIAASITTDGFILSNSSVATSGATVQNSSVIRFHANVWNTTATAANNYIDWTEGIQVTSGLVPSSKYVWRSSKSTTTTPSYGDRMTLTDGGNLTVIGNLNGNVIQAQGASWTETQFYSHGSAIGTGLWLNSAVNFFTVTPSADGHSGNLGFNTSTFGGTPTSVLKWDDSSNVTIANSLKLSSTQTSVGGSTSGTAVFAQPFQGSSYKVVIIKLAALVGTASYTFPTAFTTTPSVVATDDVAAGIVTSKSTSAVTVTGTTTTGTIKLIGY